MQNEERKDRRKAKQSMAKFLAEEMPMIMTEVEWAATRKFCGSYRELSEQDIPKALAGASY